MWLSSIQCYTVFMHRWVLIDLLPKYDSNKCLSKIVLIIIFCFDFRHYHDESGRSGGQCACEGEGC